MVEWNGWGDQLWEEGASIDSRINSLSHRKSSRWWGGRMGMTVSVDPIINPISGKIPRRCNGVDPATTRPFWGSTDLWY